MPIFHPHVHEVFKVATNLIFYHVDKCQVTNICHKICRIVPKVYIISALFCDLRQNFLFASNNVLLAESSHSFLFKSPQRICLFSWQKKVLEEATVVRHVNDWLNSIPVYMRRYLSIIFYPNGNQFQWYFFLCFRVVAESTTTLIKMVLSKGEAEEVAKQWSLEGEIVLRRTHSVSMYQE